MEIKKIAYDLSVCKVEDYSLVNLDAEYCFVGKTDEEKSLVCLTCDVPGNVTDRDDGWKAFRIQGVLDFSSDTRGYFLFVHSGPDTTSTACCSIFPVAKWLQNVIIFLLVISAFPADWNWLVF